MKTITILTLLFLLSVPSGLLSQISTFYWSNGKIKEQGMMRDSVKVGVWKTWYKDGQLADSGSYIRGMIDMVKVKVGDVDLHGIDTTEIKKKMVTDNFSVKTGKWIANHDNGKRLEEGEYLPLEIIRIEFIEDIEGHLRYVATLPEPIKIGRWKEWDRYGSLVTEKVYKNDGSVMEVVGNQ
jgi:antitoxin component YwqK of YwqJK toxin-antitoxin module